MTYFFRINVTIILAMTVFGKVFAVQLPLPAELAAKYNLSVRKVTVVEPHESTNDRRTLREYNAFPLDSFLGGLFGDGWMSDDAEILFFAKDGYRSVVASQKLKKYRAFLAFARTDGSSFIVDNTGQNEHRIPLGPYYLIWDNLGAKELIHEGAYGWPYQITEIEWRRKNENLMLRPRLSSKILEQGLEETGHYCLTCHNIRGIGGKKYPLDLIRATCRWQESDLKAWIDSPSTLKPGTTMPPLARQLSSAERHQIIERIVGYLKSMRAESSEPCAAN